MAKKKTKRQKWLEKGMDIPRAPIIYEKTVPSKKEYDRKKEKKIEEN